MAKNNSKTGDNGSDTETEESKSESVLEMEQYNRERGFNFMPESSPEPSPPKKS